MTHNHHQENTDMTIITDDTRRTGAALIAATLGHDQAALEALTHDLDDQELHEILMCALACAAHCIRGTEAEATLAAVLLGAAVRHRRDET